MFECRLTGISQAISNPYCWILLGTVNPVTFSFSNMADAPPVSSGTLKRQSNASSAVRNDIEGAVNDFMVALDAIATKHAQ